MAQGRLRARVHRGEGRGGAWGLGECQGQLEHVCLMFPLQILSFPSHSGSEASARPCAHLRHTQTLRRVLKVCRSAACSDLTASLQGSCVSVRILTLLSLWPAFPFPACVEPLRLTSPVLMPFVVFANVTWVWWHRPCRPSI